MKIELIVSGIAGIAFAFFYLRFLFSSHSAIAKLISIVVLFVLLFYLVVIWGSLPASEVAQFEDYLIGGISGCVLGALGALALRSRKT